MANLLYITNVAGKRMSYSFSGSALEAAKSLNFVFFAGANRAQATADDMKCDEEKYGIHMLHIPICRSPYSYQNIKAYKQLCNIIRDNKIDYIHCNTPVGGLLGRLAGKKCGVKKVIYQAHGFHFYKGAPKRNWLLYYPVEKWLARYTDALITINQEDYELAQKNFRLRNNGNVYYVPGVGIDTTQYASDDAVRQRKRKDLDVNNESVFLISMGDLNKNKSYATAIRAVAAANNPNLHYFICGTGPEENTLKKLAKKLGVFSQVHFLGFRSDIKELLCASDIFLFTSRREGLSRSMMEAMASGLPCIASRIRGNTDLLEGIDGGFLCQTNDFADYADKINRLAGDETLRKRMGDNNRIAIRKFSMDTVVDSIKDIYELEFQEE